MQLILPSYIEHMLTQASYEYDPATKSWCGWVEVLPGAYAQAATVEDVRNQLAEVIEEFVFVTVARHDNVPSLMPLLEKFNYAQARK